MFHYWRWFAGKQKSKQQPNQTKTWDCSTYENKHKISLLWCSTRKTQNSRKSYGQNIRLDMYMYVCAYMCVWVCACVCLLICVHMCLCMCALHLFTGLVYSVMFFLLADYVCLAHMALLEIGLRLGQAREGVSHRTVSRGSFRTHASPFLIHLLPSYLHFPK